MSWKKEKIGVHCEITSSKRIFFNEYVERGVPFYRSKEIIEKSQGKEISEPLFISHQKYDEIKNKYGVPASGDMLLTSVGTIGIPYIVKDNEDFYFKDGNLTWFRKFDAMLSSRFLCYWLGSKEGYGVLNNSTIGSSQKALTISSLNEIQCPLPPISIQEHIVDILASYDSFIDTNQRQIKLLEEAAQRLYREWFVDLRFPGHEDVPVVDGVPEGWRRAEVGTLIGKVARTTQIMTAEYKASGRIPVVDQSREFIAGYTDDETAMIDLKTPVIVFGDHTRILKYIMFPFAKGADGTQLIISKYEQMPQSLLYFSLIHVDLSNYHYARHFKYLKAEQILVPTKEIARRFDDAVSPLMSGMQTKRDQNIALSEARDRLLPKLMSGEIAV